MSQPSPTKQTSSTHKQPPSNSAPTGTRVSPSKTNVAAIAAAIANYNPPTSPSIPPGTRARSTHYNANVEQATASFNAATHPTPSSSPRKRPLSPLQLPRESTSDTMGRTPTHASRIAKIEVAMQESRAQATPRSAAGPNRRTDIFSPAPVRRTLTTAVQTDDVEDDEAEDEIEQETFLDAEDRSHISDVPGTPSPHRRAKRAKLDQPEGHSRDQFRDSAGLLTPPQSSQMDDSLSSTSGLNGYPQTPTKSKGKGKEREIVVDAAQSQSSEAQYYHEHHSFCEEGSEMESHDPQPSRGIPAISFSSSQTNPDDGELTARSISALLERLSAAPEYIAKLERKRLAAERSSEAKAKRIAELDRENQQLKAKIAVLEAKNNFLEAQRRLDETTLQAVTPRR
ncbi:hypothetical protein JAAARDRAFT_47631 [Jaapia argillacea MUCL 33604]|uniref:BZIP domain-containing protein n=1 Tax=Jaapia argillacea MUCL 33604 TaxID=933084 RepID=A0A067PSK2_9AGAM|nr:hypothetical protein JAAARDRAFT_47631 [Jaapia argillacea MUCL 33604]